MPNSIVSTEYNDPWIVFGTVFSGTFILGVIFLFLINAAGLAFVSMGTAAIVLTGKAISQEYKIRQMAREVSTL